MPETQTLEVGQSIAQQYGNFGSSLTDQPELGSLFTLVIGKKQAGKTSLFLDNPGALIVNFDGSSIPLSSALMPAPKAQFFPGRNAKGQFVGADGKQLAMDWGEIVALKDRLIAAAKSNKPRPQTIVFDSITAALRLAKDYILEQSVKLGITKESKDSWKNMDGRSAYATLYDMIVDISIELWQQGGYGVVWIVHLYDSHETITLPNGQEINKEQSKLSTTEAFLTRALPFFELLIYIEKKHEVTTVANNQVRVIDGKTVNIPGTRAVERDVRVLHFKGDPSSSEPQIALPAARIPMPETLTIVDEGTSWKQLKAAYDAAKEQTK